MKVLSKCQDSFEKMRLGGIAEYFRFLYCIEEYLEDSRLIMFCTESVNELERIFANPSKEMMNEATK